MILSFDLGNYNIKTSREVKFISTFREVIDIDATEMNVIEYKGKKYIMETMDKFDNEFNKANKNYIPNLLWAIEKSVEDDVILDITLNVPVENNGVAEQYKEQLTNKTFEFTAKGKHRTVQIRKVAVLEEGLGAFFTLSQKEMLHDTMMIDIGGRTTNVLTFVNARKEHKKQINLGMINFYEDVRMLYNRQGKNAQTHKIKSMIERNIIPADIVERCTEKFIKDILNEIKTIGDRDNYKIWFTGGGSEELKQSIIAIEPNANFVNDPLMANVNGSEKIAKLTWRE